MTTCTCSAIQILQIDILYACISSPELNASGKKWIGPLHKKETPLDPPLSNHAAVYNV